MKDGFQNPEAISWVAIKGLVVFDKMLSKCAVNAVNFQVFIFCTSIIGYYSVIMETTRQQLQIRLLSIMLDLHLAYIFGNTRKESEQGSYFCGLLWRELSFFVDSYG